MTSLNYLRFIVASLVIISCNRKEEVEPSLDGNSKLIGDYIYTLVDGDNQVGSKGQLLPEEIVVRVTDLRGNPLRRNLDFSAGESGAEVRLISYNDSIGESRISWRLDCENARQTLEIIDQVCGVYAEGCRDETVIEVRASASGQVEGWNRSCHEFEFANNFDSKIFINENQVFLTTRSVMYRATDVGAINWDSFEPEEDLLGNTQVFIPSSHAIYRSKYGRYFISGYNGDNWFDFNFYISNGSEADGRVVRNQSGKHYFIEEGEDFVLKQPPSIVTPTWESIGSISGWTGGRSDKAQAITSSEGRIIIVTTNNLVLTIENDSAQVIEFPNDSWPSTLSSLDDFDARLHDNYLFLLVSNKALYKLDLNSQQVTNEINSNSLRLANNFDHLYVIDGSEGDFWEYANGSLHQKAFEFPESDSEFYDLNFINGNPIFLSRYGRLFFYR